MDAWTIVRGIFILGMGIHSFIDSGDTLKDLFNVAEDDVLADLTRLGGNVTEVRMGIEKVVNNQAILLAQFRKARVARDLKGKMNSLSLAYGPLVDTFIKSAEHSTQCLSEIAKEDAYMAIMRADDLYAWAETFLPNKSQATLSRWAKLELMPYVVAMAYAVRVKMDAHLVQSKLLSESSEAQYLQRNYAIVDDFISVLQPAIVGLISNTSLLEIALDYHQPLATYVTLIETLRTSAQLMLPLFESTPEKIAVWDDGLSGIRALLRCDAGSGASTIPLDNVKESIWWAEFTGHDLEGIKIKRLRKAVHLQELLFILGADHGNDGDDDSDDDDDDDDSVFSLAPDYKRVLLQLPSAHSLQTALHMKLTAALDVPLPHSALESFARVRNAPEITPTAPTKPRVRLSLVIDDGPSPLTGLAVSADGERLVSGKEDGAVHVWSRSTGQLLHILTGHLSDVTCVALTPDGKRVISGGGDGFLRLWSIDSGTQQRVYVNGDYDRKRVLEVMAWPDGQTAVSISEDGPRIWDIHSRRPKGSFVSGFYRQSMWSPVLSQDGKTFASIAPDGMIGVWSLGTQNSQSDYGEDGAVKYSAQHKLEFSPGHFDIVSAVAFTSDGERLVSASWDETIKVWEMHGSKGEEIMSFTAHTAGVNCIMALPDGDRLVSGSDDGTVRIWNMRTRELEHTLTEHADAVKFLAVSHDGKTLVSGSTGTIMVWELS